mgnify:FL=1
MKDGSRRPGFNYVTVVGVAFVVVIVLALVNMLRTEDSGTVGIGDVGRGEPVPKFAVPVASSDLDGDANIDPKQACKVEGADVIRVCDYFDRPLVMSFWFTKGGSQCIDQQDVFDDVALGYKRRLGALSINVRDDRDDVRSLIEEHGWKVPVGYDRDGAVSNIYRVGGCPTFIYVRKGGVMKNATIGPASAEELNAQIRSLLNE